MMNVRSSLSANQRFVRRTQTCHSKNEQNKTQSHNYLHLWHSKDNCLRSPLGRSVNWHCYIKVFPLFVGPDLWTNKFLGRFIGTMHKLIQLCLRIRFSQSMTYRIVRTFVVLARYTYIAPCAFFYLLKSSQNSRARYLKAWKRQTQKVQRFLTQEDSRTALHKRQFGWTSVEI